MKLVQLLDRANAGYPDLREFYERKTGKRKAGSGDLLAEFIVVEVSETFDERASDDEQIDMAVHVLENAQKDLWTTIGALDQG